MLRRWLLNFVVGTFTLLEVLILVSVLIDYPFTGILRNPYMIFALVVATVILIVVMALIPKIGVPIRWKRPSRNDKGHGIYK